MKNLPDYDLQPLWPLNHPFAAYIGLRSKNIVMGSDIPQICLKIILLAIT